MVRMVRAERDWRSATFESWFAMIFAGLQMDPTSLSLRDLTV